MGKAGTGQKSINIAPKKATNRKFILLNKYDERIDPELPRVDTSAQARLYDRIQTKGKVCNIYHLTGKCDAGEYCDYHHGEPLSPGELLALRIRARKISCVNSSHCRDFDCTYGHICPCKENCKNDICWFEDVHGVDTVSGIVR